MAKIKNDFFFILDSSGCSTPPTTVSIDTCDSGFTDELCPGKEEIMANSANQCNRGSQKNNGHSNDHPVKCQIGVRISPSNESSESNLSTPSDGGEGRGGDGGSNLNISPTSSDRSVSDVYAKNAITNMVRRQTTSKLNGSKTVDSEAEEEKTEEDADDDVPRRNRKNVTSCSEENSILSADDNNDETDDDDEEDDDDEDSTSNLSRLSDISDVPKLNDVQRSLEWVSRKINSKTNFFLTSNTVGSLPPCKTFLNLFHVEC